MSALIRGNHERTVTAFYGDLQLWQKLGDRGDTVFCLLGLAAVPAQRGEPVRATRLWGAAEALEESVSFVHDSPFVRSQYDYEGLLSMTRARLGEAAFERARAERAKA